MHLRNTMSNGCKYSDYKKNYCRNIKTHGKSPTTRRLHVKFKMKNTLNFLLYNKKDIWHILLHLSQFCLSNVADHQVIQEIEYGEEKSNQVR